MDDATRAVLRAHADDLHDASTVVHRAHRVASLGQVPDSLTLDELARRLTGIAQALNRLSKEQ